MGKAAGRKSGRIVAIGDLHGNYAGLHRILQKTGILDRRDRWVAHDTRLVQLGDILGRGGEPGKIFRLLKRLEQEAPRYGSSVHVLLGNHEAMSMSGMLMYNTLEEFRDLAEEDLLETARGGAPREDRDRGASPAELRMGRRLDLMGCREFRDSLAPEGKVGHWLAHHDTAVSLDGNLFVHGGLNREYGLMPLDALNDKVRREIFASDGEGPDWTAGGEIMLRRDGPQWNRDLPLRPDAGKAEVLEEVLAYHGCARLVVGHTPTSCIDPDRAGRIIPLYGGRLWCVDTGIGKAYGQRLSALVIQGDTVTAEYP